MKRLLPTVAITFVSLTSIHCLGQEREFRIDPAPDDGYVLYQRFETNPLWGESFWCFVTNVSPNQTATVLNLRIHDGEDGRVINKEGAPDPIADCSDSGSLVLQPNQTCGVRGYSSPTGSSNVDPTAAHCVFLANGQVRGTLQARFRETLINGNYFDAQLSTSAKPARDY